MKRRRISNEAAMAAFGAALGRACPPQVFCLVYLTGELGAGKTTLARGMLRAMGWQGPVKSPTYTLLESYEVAGRHVHHLDLYRLGDPEELEYLGLRDLLQSNAIMLVEWPQRGQGVLPGADVTVHIEYDEDGRQVFLTALTPTGVEITDRLTDG